MTGCSEGSRAAKLHVADLREYLIAGRTRECQTPVLPQDGIDARGMHREIAHRATAGAPLAPPSVAHSAAPSTEEFGRAEAGHETGPPRPHPRPSRCWRATAARCRARRASPQREVPCNPQCSRAVHNSSATALAVAPPTALMKSPRCPAAAPRARPAPSGASSTDHKTASSRPGPATVAPASMRIASAVPGTASSGASIASPIVRPRVCERTTLVDAPTNCAALDDQVRFLREGIGILNLDAGQHLPWRPAQKNLEAALTDEEALLPC